MSKRADNVLGLFLVIAIGAVIGLCIAAFIHEKEARAKCRQHGGDYVQMGDGHAACLKKGSVLR